MPYYAIFGALAATVALVGPGFWAWGTGGLGPERVLGACRIDFGLDALRWK